MSDDFIQTSQTEYDDPRVRAGSPLPWALFGVSLLAMGIIGFVAWRRIGPLTHQVAEVGAQATVAEERARKAEERVKDLEGQLASAEDRARRVESERDALADKLRSAERALAKTPPVTAPPKKTPPKRTTTKRRHR